MEAKINENPLKGAAPSSFVLLGFLMDGDKHGYEITKCLTEDLANIWHVGTSQVYFLLNKLENKGLIHSRSEQEANRPPKNTFSITDEGKILFIKWIHSPTEHVRDLRMEFLAKLYFFNRLLLPEGADLIRKQKKRVLFLKNKISARRMEEEDRYLKLIYGFKIAQCETCMKWLNDEAESFMAKTEKLKKRKVTAKDSQSIYEQIEK